jgi:hypothetical protein
VDINEAFLPDIVADAQIFNIWRYLIDCAGLRAVDGSVTLPACWWFSPPCSTFCRAEHFHGRNARYPGGFEDDAAAAAANMCAYVICFFLEQLRRAGLHYLYIIENPADSRMWQLPCMVDLLSRSTSFVTSYCVWGSGVKKTTRFVCDPRMQFPCARRVAGGPGLHNFALLCCHRGAGAGGCGGMVSLPEPMHFGRRGGFSIVDSEVPLMLAGELHRSWLRVDGPLRLAAADVSVVPLGVVTALALDWDLDVDGPDTFLDSDVLSSSDDDSSGGDFSDVPEARGGSRGAGDGAGAALEAVASTLLNGPVEPGQQSSSRRRCSQTQPAFSERRLTAIPASSTPMEVEADAGTAAVLAAQLRGDRQMAQVLSQPGLALARRSRSLPLCQRCSLPRPREYAAGGSLLCRACASA